MFLDFAGFIAPIRIDPLRDAYSVKTTCGFVFTLYRIRDGVYSAAIRIENRNVMVFLGPIENLQREIHKALSGEGLGVLTLSPDAPVGGPPVAFRLALVMMVFFAVIVAASTTSAYSMILAILGALLAVTAFVRAK